MRIQWVIIPLEPHVSVALRAVRGPARQSITSHGLLIWYPQPFHFLLPRCRWNRRVANSPVEVKRENCGPEHNFTRFVSHLSNSADGGERLPRRDGLEVANDLQKERGVEQRGEGGRNVWPPTLPQTEWLMRVGIFSTVGKPGAPACSTLRKF